MFVNVPVGLLALELTPIFLSETTTRTEHRHIDVLGAFTNHSGSYKPGRNLARME